MAYVATVYEMQHAAQAWLLLVYSYLFTQASNLVMVLLQSVVLALQDYVHDSARGLTRLTTDFKKAQALLEWRHLVCETC